MGINVKIIDLVKVQLERALARQERIQARRCHYEAEMAEAIFDQNAPVVLRQTIQKCIDDLELQEGAVVAQIVGLQLDLFKLEAEDKACGAEA